MTIIKKRIELNCADYGQLIFCQEAPNHYDEKSIHVWILDINAFSQTELDKFYELLDAKEQQKANRYLKKEDRNTCILGHGMVRQLGRQYSNNENLQIEYNKYGKPFFSNLPNLTFNLSHSENIIAVAFRFTSGSIGLDLEFINSTIDIKGIINNYFRKEEKDIIKNDVNKFFKYWTRKEAFLKFIGTGLAENIKDFSVNNGQQSFDFVTLDSHNPILKMISFNFKSTHFISLVTDMNDFKLSFYQFRKIGNN